MATGQMDEHAATLRSLLDRQEIHELVDRYMASHDGAGASQPEADLFTADARLEPAYSAPITGRRAIVEFQHTIMAKFERRQHTACNTLVEVHGDVASLRTNMVVHQVHHPAMRGDGPGALLAGGGYLEGEAVRTDAGWRLHRLTYTSVWRDGQLPFGVVARA